MARIFAMVAGLAFIGLAFMTPEPASQGNDKTTRTRMSAMEWNIDRFGLDYQGFDLTNDDPKLCQSACEDDPQCKAWTYVRPNTLQGPKPRCWLKHAIPSPEKKSMERVRNKT
jgi:PAN domain